MIVYAATQSERRFDNACMQSMNCYAQRYYANIAWYVLGLTRCPKSPLKVNVRLSKLK